MPTIGTPGPAAARSRVRDSSPGFAGAGWNAVLTQVMSITPVARLMQRLRSLAPMSMVTSTVDPRWAGRNASALASWEPWS